MTNDTVIYVCVGPGVPPCTMKDGDYQVMHAIYVNRWFSSDNVLSYSIIVLLHFRDHEVHTFQGISIKHQPHNASWYIDNII